MKWTPLLIFSVTAKKKLRCAIVHCIRKVKICVFNGRPHDPNPNDPLFSENENSEFAFTLSGRPTLACKTTSSPLFRFFFSVKWNEFEKPRKIVLAFENCRYVVTIASKMKTLDLNGFDAHENVLIYTVLHEVRKIVSRKYLAPIL